MPTIAANRANIKTLQDDYKDELTEWEANFLKSIDSRLNRMIPLSDKQQAVLDNLLVKIPERAGHSDEPEDEDDFPF